MRFVNVGRYDLIHLCQNRSAYCCDVSHVFLSAIAASLNAVQGLTPAELPIRKWLGVLDLTISDNLFFRVSV